MLYFKLLLEHATVISRQNTTLLVQTINKTTLSLCQTIKPQISKINKTTYPQITKRVMLMMSAQYLFLIFKLSWFLIKI